MSARVAAVALDCAEPDAQATFWTAALDSPVSHTWSDAYGARYLEIELPGTAGVVLLLQAVGDAAKVGKNRLHLDLRPAGASGRDDEVDRLTGLGAVVLDDDGALPWVVMADPEGNEFCVLPAAREWLSRSRPR